MIFAFILTCRVRTIEEQAAFYAQGREDIAAVNALRRLAGMPPVGAEANRIVTHARPGQFNAPLRARPRHCASGWSKVCMERLPSCLAEGRQDRERNADSNGRGIGRDSGSMPISSTRAQSRREQGGEETGDVTLCGIW